jgi:hypothetical protein
MGELWRRLLDAPVEKDDPSGRWSSSRVSLLAITAVVLFCLVWVVVVHGDQPEAYLGLIVTALILVWALKQAFTRMSGGDAASVLRSLMGRFGEGAQRINPLSRRPTQAEQEAASAREVEGQEG